MSRTESRLFGLCLKHWCLLLYKALEGLADGREGLRDSVPVPAEGVMLEEGEGKAKARPDVIFSPLCQSGKSPACKTHVPRIPPIADQACTLIQNSTHFSFSWLGSSLTALTLFSNLCLIVGVSDSGSDLMSLSVPECLFTIMAWVGMASRQCVFSWYAFQIPTLYEGVHRQHI